MSTDLDNDDPPPESCGAKVGECPHMSIQGCILQYGCIWFSDEANEQERIEFEEKSFLW